MNDPEMYMKIGNAQLPYLQGLINTHVKKFPWSDKENILDIGCGTGKVTTELILPALPKDAKVMGIDKSKAMIEFATKNYSHKNVEYKVMDIQEKLSEWQAGSFDKIFSFFSYHFITNFRQAANNLSFLIKKNGYILIHLVSKYPINKILQNLEKDPAWSPYLKETDMSLRMLENCRDPCEFLNNHFTSAGFDILKTLFDKHQGTFSDVNNFMNLFRSITPLTAKVPADKLEKLCYLVKEEFLKNESVIVENTGEVKVTWENIIIIAKKM